MFDEKGGRFGADQEQESLDGGNQQWNAQQNVPLVARSEHAFHSQKVRNQYSGHDSHLVENSQRAPQVHRCHFGDVERGEPSENPAVDPEEKARDNEQVENLSVVGDNDAKTSGEHNGVVQQHGPFSSVPIVNLLV